MQCPAQKRQDAIIDVVTVVVLPGRPRTLDRPLLPPPSSREIGEKVGGNGDRIWAPPM